VTFFDGTVVVVVVVVVGAVIGLVVVAIGVFVALNTLADIAAHDQPLLLVHGAHGLLDDLAVRLGHPPRMVVSERGEISRYTDATTMDHFLMAYCGLANKRIVERLLGLGRNAIGLSAMDARIAVGRRRPHLRIRENGRSKVLHDDHAGSIERIDTTVLSGLLEMGLLPVLTPPALGSEGVAINVDGDRLAMELAVAFGAERLLIFSDMPGFLRDPADASTVIPRITAATLDEALASARGRGRVKLVAAGSAVARGVGAVGLVDGTRERPLTDALAGAGSWVVS